MAPREPADDRHADTGWRRPAVEAGGLQRYAEVIRQHLVTVALTVLVTLLAAAAYLAIAEDVFEAEAGLLISPASRDDPVLNRLSVIRESNDPTRDVQTVAKLVETREVAIRVAEDLNLAQSPKSLLNDIEAVPVAQTNIVSVSAQAGNPERARDIANTFAEQVVAERTEEFHRQIDLQLPGLRSQLPGTPGPDSPESQIGLLEILRNGPDPTIRLETRATAPTSPTSPRPRLTIIAGLLAGVILGIGGAFAIHALDPRFRREEQLKARYNLPVLARITKEPSAQTTSRGGRRFRIGPRRKPRRALGPGQLSRSTLEGYRTLRAMLGAAQGKGRGGRSLLVTGPSPAEGKTTTAIALASSLALAGNRVVFIEADFRIPSAGEALGIRPPIGIANVLLGTASLEDALVPVKPFGDNFRALLVSQADDFLADMLSLPSANGLLDEAGSLADYVVVDSPPLIEVIDALPLAQQVDDVILVMRLGTSRLSALSRLADLLDQNGITPAGIVVVGVGSSEKTPYYLGGRHARTSSDWLTTQPPGNGEDEPSTAGREPAPTTEA